MTNNQNKTNKITARKLIRWSGLSAMAAGIIFAAIQPIHPPDVLASVTTSAWAIIMPIKLAMCILFLLGITGLSWTLQTAFIFTEAFILPVLATTTPKFVESVLGIVNGFPGEMNIGAIPAVYGVVGIMYLLGGLLFGIATFRAHILPRWAAGLLAIASVVTPLAALLPHAIQRFAAVPVGLALAWMGYALFSESLPGKDNAEHIPA